jgi:acid phosphatase (class A)
MKIGFFAFLLGTALGLCPAVRSETGMATQNAPSSTAAAAPSDLPDHTIYLNSNEDVWKSFPKGPALGSPVDQTDLVVTLSVQASRTQAQVAEARRDQNYSIKLMTDLIDPSFAAKYPNTFQVLTDADDDAYVITSMLKGANGRPRPYVQHPLLVLPLFTATDFSYPSGHASGMELQARILGWLFPPWADQLINRARQVADSRVVAGVHYASDTEAGLKLGDLLFDQLQLNPKFMAALAAAVAADHLPLR